MAIVLVLGVTVSPLDGIVIFRFLLGGILLILGLTLFLLGVDIGIQPLGERTGAALTSKRNLFLLLSVSFVIGFLVTVAEPDIQVFASQTKSIFSSVNKTHIVYAIAAGVAIFITIGLLRVVLHLPMKILLFLLYGLLFVLSYFAPNSFLGVAFDSGGATTGPMTVPFILALGIGVNSVTSSKKADDSDKFGLTGITSIGPIATVLLYGIILSRFSQVSQNTTINEIAEIEKTSVFLKIFPHYAREAIFSIAPLVLMLAVFQITLLHLPKRQIIRMFIGLVWSYLGLTIFLVGVQGGFMVAGEKLGIILGAKAVNFGGFWMALLIFVGATLGAVIVSAEPAVWVLTEQVENLSGGTIKRRVMLIFLAVGSSVAIGLAVWKAVSGIDFIKILLPGYALALLLMIFCPKMWTAIAFDSGGVASGPITSTFVLSFALGAAKASGKNADAFGVIALVAMTPLIAIQILGIIYSRKRKRL